VKVVVACEYSGRVRDAFRALGHDAVSVDLLPTEVPGPHIVGDALDAIRRESPDLLVAHPPCTYLANSGVRWLYGGKGTTIDPVRWGQMVEGAAFFKALLDSPVPMVAVENPVMHGFARDLVGESASQFIHPWQFGHGEQKTTGLWLRGLPLLTPTDVVEGREQRVWRMGPSADRWKERSRTFSGIAAAMAAQWGGLDR
jgi:hypothetical protein